MSATSTATVSCVADTGVTARLTPLNVAVDVLRNPVPFTVSAKPAPSITAVPGERLVMVGTGLGAVTVPVTATSLLAEPLTLVTLPLKVPAAAPVRRT